MPMPAVTQTSFFDPAFLCRGLIAPGTLQWLLAFLPSTFCPPALVKTWERAGLPGRDPWPFRVLAAVLLLRFCEEGMSRRAAARACHENGAWRAAAGLDWRDATPDESELRRFEKYLRGRDEQTGARRLFVWLSHVVEACIQHGVLGDRQVWVIDSAPMLCYGAILDTVRFLGDEARSLAACWAKLTGQEVERLSKEWGLPLLLAKSTKGHFRDTDWSAPDDRADAVSEVARTAVEVASRIRDGLEQIRSAGKRKQLARRCRNISRKICEDLETDERGRLVIARRVVEDRLVSRTDPEARHARKSRSRVFNGYKFHVLGENFSGLIAAVCATPANIHDGAVAHRLIGRAKEIGSDIKRVLGDTHYGSARLRKVVRETLDVELLGKPQPLPERKDDRFRKQDFDIDFDSMTATCPEGVATTVWSWHRQRKGEVETPAFCWSKDTCSQCPSRERCLDKHRGGRRLQLHPHEQELREQRAQWEDGEAKEIYRERSQGERHVNTLASHGCRKARAWGLQAAQVQVHAVAIASNLKLLARALQGAGGT